jgi:hypothetical protein
LSNVYALAIVVLENVALEKKILKNVDNTCTSLHNLSDPRVMWNIFDPRGEHNLYNLSKMNSKTYILKFVANKSTSDVNNFLWFSFNNDFTHPPNRLSW